MAYRGPKPREISRGVWEIEPWGDMGAPARVYASRQMMPAIMRDDALQQICNVACLPGLVGPSLAMPDIHQGYGFPIGGVAAFDRADGVVSPGGVGYDINCGVRLMRTNLSLEEVGPHVRSLALEVARSVPAGLGSSDAIRCLSEREMDGVLIRGAAWAVEQGYGEAEDIEATESQGCMEGADPSAVSARAKQRGASQVGTLGSGNHFIEIQEVAEVLSFDQAEAFGLFPGQVVFMLHSGSRGLGYQVCDDALRAMRGSARKYGFRLPDPQLAAVPIESPEGRAYLAGMRAAANYAWANRQTMGGLIERAVESVLGLDRSRSGFALVWDLAHNIAKEEEHAVGGRRKSLLVHRKGATRAFAAGHPELPGRFRPWGQPVLVPGDMGRGSFVCVGLDGAMEETWGSCSHGAGRRLSRKRALREARGRDIFEELEGLGVLVSARSKRTIAEEMPEAYKDVRSVVGALEGAGIARPVARLRPLAVVKG